MGNIEVEVWEELNLRQQKMELWVCILEDGMVVGKIVCDRGISPAEVVNLLYGTGMDLYDLGHPEAELYIEASSKVPGGNDADLELA